MNNLFIRSWKGEASLAAAFWIIHFLFGIILRLIIMLIFAAFIANFFTPGVYTYYNDLMTTIVFPYTLFAAICVWRCGKNSAIFWNILAKIIIILGLLFSLVAILHVLGIFKA